MRASDAKESGVCRPGLGRGPLLTRTRHDLQGRHGPGALAVSRPDAVRPGIATTNHDDVFAGSNNLVLNLFTQRGAIGRRQELHGLQDTAQLTSGDHQVTWDGGAESQNDRVIPVAQGLSGQVPADVDAVSEPRALSLHLCDTTV